MSLRPCALFFSPVCSHPMNAGNRSRMFHLLQCLEELGCDFKFIYLAGNSQKSEQRLDQMKARWNDRFELLPYQEGFNGFARLGKFDPKNRTEILLDDWFDDRLFTHFESLLSRFKPQIVLTTYATTSKVFEYFDRSVKKILDTYDILGKRAEKLRLRGIGDPGWYSCSKEEEALALSRADAAIAIKKEDQDYFQSIARTPVSIVGHLIKPQITARPGEQKILYLSSGGETNIASLNNFLSHTFPLLVRRSPNLKIIFAGKICDAIMQTSKNFDIRGHVEDLSALYGEVDAAINCDIFGSGISIKTITALAHGCPVVSTEIGARGLGTSDSGLMVTVTAEQSAEAILKIINDTSYRQRLSAQAYAYSNEYYRTQVEQLKLLVAD